MVLAFWARENRVPSHVRHHGCIMVLCVFCYENERKYFLVLFHFCLLPFCSVQHMSSVRSGHRRLQVRNLSEQRNLDVLGLEYMYIF
jgi:hypothetical protein